MKARALCLAVACALFGCSADTLRSTGRLLAVEPARIQFGEVVVGTTKVERIQLLNLGRAPLHLAILDLPEGFEVEPLSFSLEAGSEFELEVRFRPVAGRFHGGDILLDSTGGESATLHVQGTGLSNLLEAPATVDFGPIPLGERSELLVLIRSLVDQEIVVFMEVSGSEHFWIGDESMVIEGGAKAEVPITFRPMQEAGRTAKLLLTSCEGCETHSVLLFGEGVGKKIGIDPLFLDFGGVAVGLEKISGFEVRNLGITPLNLVFPPPADPAFQINRERYRELGPGEAVSVQVSFSPFDRSQREETLQLEDEWGWRLGEIYLRGEGIASLEPSPSRIHFLQPAGLIRSREIELRSLNPSREVRITEYGLLGQEAEKFELEGPQAGATVGRRSQRFLVRYQAEEKARHEAELVIHTEDSLSRVIRIPIVGEDLTQDCDLRRSHEVIDFGLIPATGSLVRSFEIENVGEDLCFLWDLRLVGCVSCDEYFRILDPVGTELLWPGEVLVVDLEPGTRSSSSVSLRYRYGNPSIPPAEVGLRSSLMRPDFRRFHVEPSGTLQLGDTAIGDRSLARVTIRAQEGSAGMVRSIALGEGSSLAFRLAPDNPPIPQSFDEEGTHFEVLFEPRTVGRHYAQVEVVLVGLPLGNPIRFDLAGSGMLEVEAP